MNNIEFSTKNPNKGKEIRVTIDFNGAFIYCPKAISMKGKNVTFTVKNGYWVSEGTIEKASESLNSGCYIKWIKKFRKLK